jgi:hypothetical protein
VQLAELANHEVTEFGVERAERLVHQEDFRPPHDGAAERDTLAVAAGEPGDRLVEDVIDPQEPRRLLHTPLDFSARRSLCFQREADVLAHVHVRIKGEELKDESDVPLRGAPESHVLAVEQDLSGGRQLQAGDHAQRRRLAAAGRPEHDEELAVRDGEVGILHRDEIGELLAEMLDADLSHGASFREMADDDEHRRTGEDRHERIGEERQGDRLHQHDDAERDQRDRGILPGPAAEIAGGRMNAVLHERRLAHD